MRNRCKARLADRLAAFGAGTEGSSLDAGKGCLYGGKLLLTRLTQTFEHLVIVALDCPVVIIDCRADRGPPRSCADGGRVRCGALRAPAGNVAYPLGAS